VATAAALAATGCSGGETDDGTAAASESPAGRSLVVIGHSGATGANSDPDKPGLDVPANSWATGTNPEVNSIYRRLAARDQSYKPVNLAVNGADAEDLLGQARTAVALTPKPDIVLVQGISNDIRCDGSDPQNYAPFAETTAEMLDTLAQGLPDAKIYMVGLANTVEGYARVLGTIPHLRSRQTGDGVCDWFDANGRVRPQAIAYEQGVTDRYEAEQTKACARVPNCRTDEGALRKLVEQPADLSSDGHPSISGHRKHAELVWQTFFA
jgi:lysophospholipase L1-like esterase